MLLYQFVILLNDTIGKYMKRIVTVDKMKQIDRVAIEKHCIPELLLMENAGRSIAEVVIEQYKKIETKKGVLIFSGKGNNGADGLVCARYIKQFNIPVKVILLAEPIMLKGSLLMQYKICDSFDVKIFSVTNISELKKVVNVFLPSIVVDAIFGIGFKGDVSGIYKDVIELINNLSSYVISVDVPSGLNAVDGSAKLCVKADKTVTIGFAKTGFFKRHGPKVCGKIKIADIGFC